MTRDCNIYAVGVGGQGVMRLSQVLAAAAVRAGMPVKVSEVHGGAQRGGVATSHIRIGGGVFAPVIPGGEADVVVGLEPLEAARSGAAILRDGGLVLLNTQGSATLSVLTGRESYPALEELVCYLRAATPRVRLIPATDLADRLGRRILANVVMLGALARSGLLPFEAEAVRTVLLETVPAGSQELNIAAFSAGYAAMEEGRDCESGGA